MKQKDIAVIAAVAFLSVVISFVVSSKIFVTSENRQQHAEKIDPIIADFTLPDARYFNADSINPTYTPALGSSNNQNPFNGSGQ